MANELSMSLSSNLVDGLEVLCRNLQYVLNLADGDWWCVGFGVDGN
mgnify:CR=1 FL=1